MNYIIGEYYEGLGKYVGVIKVHPHNEKIILVNHRFIENPPFNRTEGKVNEITFDVINK